MGSPGAIYAVPTESAFSATTTRPGGSTTTTLPAGCDLLSAYAAARCRLELLAGAVTANDGGALESPGAAAVALPTALRRLAAGRTVATPRALRDPRGVRRADPIRAILIAACAVACAGIRRASPPTPSACVAPARWMAPATRRERPAADVIARAARARIVLLGEHHDHADHHRWQLHTLAALAARRRRLVIGFEMFPRRVQPALDQWTAGGLDAATLLREADWHRVWGFPPDLYLPLFEFARLNRVPMRALNVDRDLVTRVGREGWVAVPMAAREGVGNPAPPAPAYRAALDAILSAHGAGADLDPEARQRFVDAQLLWDRAFAEGLAAAARDEPDALVVGIVGSGHLEHRWGVPHQLAALGIRDVVVLLPWDTRRGCDGLAPDLADAVFGIPPDPEVRAARPQLGVTLAPATGGARIAAVTPGGVGARAGLRRGDLVVEAAGATISGPADLRAVVEHQAPGTWLPLRIRRGGVAREIIARFGRPA